MKPQKPRVTVDPDATFATVAWNDVPGASYYTLKCCLKTAPDDVLTTLDVTASSALLTSLQPQTEYTVFVRTSILTQSSQFTVVHFRTLDANLMDNEGSGDSLFPSELAGPYALERGAGGYRFAPHRAALHVDGRSFQFCTFRAGFVRNRTYLILQLLGAAGPWSTATQRSRHFDDTILQLKIAGHTGWMDANALRVPGVQDKEDGARVFDGAVEDRWHTIRVTLSSVIAAQYEGAVYVRVGLTEGARSICGVKILS